VKLVDKRAADKAAHVARDRASRAREDAKVADDNGLTGKDPGENHSERQA
jgi:hypothetical protein